MTTTLTINNAVIQGNVSGLPQGGSNTTTVSNRAELKALDTNAVAGVIVGGEGGRNGSFRFNSLDLSSTLTRETISVSSVNTSTETLTSAGHNLTIGMGLFVAADTHGLIANTMYYPIVVSDDEFRLAVSLDDAIDGIAVNLADANPFTLMRHLDPHEGHYIIADGHSLGGEDGAWVRNDRAEIHAAHFGLTGDDLQPDWVYAQAAVHMAEHRTYPVNIGGGTVYMLFAPNVMKWDGVVRVNRAGINIHGSDNLYGPRAKGNASLFLHFTQNSYSSSVTGVAFQSINPSFDNLGVLIESAYTTADKCKFDGVAIGVQVQNCDNAGINGCIAEGTKTAIIVFYNSIDCFANDPVTRKNVGIYPNDPEYAIYNIGAQGTRINNPSFLNAKRMILITPSPENSVDNININGGFASEGSETGIDFASYEEGKHIQNVNVSNMSFGGDSQGIRAQGNKENIDNINFDNCMISYPNKDKQGANANLPGCGINVEFAGGGLWTFSNCQIGAMNGGTALVQASSSVKMTFTGGNIGKISGVGVSQYLFSLTGGAEAYCNGVYMDPNSFTDAIAYTDASSVFELKNPIGGILKGTYNFNSPVSIPAGATYAFPVTALHAEMGDYARASLSTLATGKVDVTAVVTGSDSVMVNFQNNTGASYNIPIGAVIKAYCEK